MKFPMSPKTARWLGWPACFALVFLSSFYLSGTEQPPLELDPSWHAALEYATAHHWQFGTQIVFTFGPLGFLSTRTSLGHLVGARVVFAFFWAGLVALLATEVAKRLAGWIRYAVLGWLVLFTLSSGLDQTAFFLMAAGTIVLLIDNPGKRWQAPLVVAAFVVLSLIKFSFLTAAMVSLVLVLICWLWQRKRGMGAALALGAPAAFVAAWMAAGQSPLHLVPWFRYGLELEAGYSAAMNLVPKTGVLAPILAALALFLASFFAAVVRSKRGLVGWGILITIAQYTFLAWKEGTTRSGNWHTFVFLWFLPLGVAFCSSCDLVMARPESRGWIFDATFAASMLAGVIGANAQIPGFTWQQATCWPQRLVHNGATILTVFRGRSDSLYAGCRAAASARSLRIDHAEDVIGSESVDVMNYLLLTAMANQLDYQPRPVIQGFVAYTPALQRLNEDYFRSARSPHYVLLCHEATDRRFPTLEDSAALNYVLNNYVPVAWDGHYLVLQQRTRENPAFHLVHEEALHFGEKLDLRAWGDRPLFMSVAITPNLVGRAAALLYQPHPLSMRVSMDGIEEQYRIVPSMAELPFLVDPVLASNYDIINFYASRSAREMRTITFERPANGPREFRDVLTVRLYTCPGFPRAAQGMPTERMLADVQARVVWPEPESVDSPSPARILIFHGSPALVVSTPSKIEIEVPGNAAVFSGYFGIPEESYTGDGRTQGVQISIAVEDRSRHSRVAFERLLQPLSHAGDRGRFRFSIPINGARDRTVTLATRSLDPGGLGSDSSLWSQCRFDGERAQ